MTRKKKVRKEESIWKLLLSIILVAFMVLLLLLRLYHFTRGIGWRTH
jgi:hypothetical protein